MVSNQDYNEIMKNIPENIDIATIDFRKTEGKKLLKMLGLTSTELKKIINNKNKEYKKENENTILEELQLGKIRNESILKKYKVDDIKSTLKDLQLDFKGKKAVLIEKLSKFIFNFNHIFDNIDKLVICQSYIRKHLVYKQIFYRGPAYINRNLSVNDTDFYTFEEISSIPNEYFFSYKDSDNFIYSYDIRSFSELLKNGYSNPYTNRPIEKNVIHKFKVLVDKLQKNNILLDYKDDIELTEEQKFNDKVLNIFQKINKLGHYSHTEWFTNLSSKKLKIWYKEAEDIFNYRAQLDEHAKKRIIPDGNAFKFGVSNVYKISDLHKRKLQEIVLNEIERFISLGSTQGDKYTGSLYMLKALTYVSHAAANSMPWLWD